MLSRLLRASVRAMNRLLLGSALTLLGCASTTAVGKPSPNPAHASAATSAATPTGVAPTAPAARFEGADYSIPVPDGYAKVDDPSLAQLSQMGGVALASRHRPEVENAFLGSIVLTPIASTAGIDLTDADQCRQVGEATAKSVTGQLDSTEIITTPASGRTCQYVVSDANNPNRKGRAVVQFRDGKGWNILCNSDARDVAAGPACDLVVQGFRFK